LGEDEGEEVSAVRIKRNEEAGRDSGSSRINCEENGLRGMVQQVSGQ